MDTAGEWLATLKAWFFGLRIVRWIVLRFAKDESVGIRAGELDFRAEGASEVRGFQQGISVSGKASVHLKDKAKIVK